MCTWEPLPNLSAWPPPLPAEKLSCFFFSVTANIHIKLILWKSKDCNSSPVYKWIQANVSFFCAVDAYWHSTPHFPPCHPTLRFIHPPFIIASLLSKVLPCSDTQQADKKAVLLLLSPSLFPLHMQSVKTDLKTTRQFELITSPSGCAFNLALSRGI